MCSCNFPLDSISDPFIVERDRLGGKESTDSFSDMLNDVELYFATFVVYFEMSAELTCKNSIHIAPSSAVAAL